MTCHVGVEFVDEFLEKAEVAIGESYFPKEVSFCHDTLYLNGDGLTPEQKTKIELILGMLAVKERIEFELRWQFTIQIDFPIMQLDLPAKIQVNYPISQVDFFNKGLKK